ncbi:MAG: hypothetical protein VW683_12205, partial [Betaproteobacteria bacterium]
MKNTYMMNTKIHDQLKSTVGDRPTYRNQEIYDAVSALGEPRKVADRLMREITKVSRGQYSFNSLAQVENPTLKVSFPRKFPRKVTEQPVAVESPAPTPPANLAMAVSSSMNDDVYVPPTNTTFVPWGDYSLIKKALQSNQFFPIFISG